MSDHQPLAARAILVVEDDFYLAEDLSDALQRAGATVLGPFASVADALALLGGTRPDLAVLDVHLGGDTSFAIGRALHSQGVPMVFATGYDAAIIPEDLAGAAHMPKPIRMAELVKALQALG